MACYVTKYHLIWHRRATRHRYAKATKKDTKKQKNGKLKPVEGVLELTVPGEPVNWITPLRESGIQFPGTRIIPLRESRI